MRKTSFRFAGNCLAVGLQLLILGACSTTEPQKSTALPGSVRSDQSSSAGRSGKAPSDQPASSLDAHREGKTPTAGPLKDIYFDFDQHTLRGDARDALKSHAAWLKSSSSAQIEIEGHCDERGTGEYNLALGAKRAQNAKDYLVTLGIPAGRISTTSYGKELQVCHEQSEACWQRNRHDRFIVKGLPTN